MTKFSKENNPGKGRPKGAKNMKTLAKQAKLSEGLANSDVQLPVELAKAILAKDADMIKALAAVLPYIYSKLTAVENFGDEEEAAGTGAYDEASVLSIIKNGE